MTNRVTNLGEYDVGTQVRLIGTFRDLATALTDPTAGTLTVRTGNNTETPIAFASWVQDALGVWHYDYTIPNQPGRFWVWWRATSGVLVSDRATFTVPTPPVDVP